MAQPGNIEALTPESRAEIDDWIAKYPSDQQQSAVMAALRIAQDQNDGHLTDALIAAIASYLDMPPVAVYEVATFSSMYELDTVDRIKLCICTNISCMLRGSDEVVGHLEERLGIKLGETTADGKFTLKEVECLGACVNAPMLQLGREYIESLTPEKLDRLLDTLE